MPSIRKRLKKLTSSKKSKSTSDLDQFRPNDSATGSHYERSADDDTCSQISEAASERTDISAMTTESSYSVTSGEKKKKRRLRLTFPRRKKKDKFVSDPSGNVVFRSLSIEHDPRGSAIHRPHNISESAEDNSELVDDRLSKSFGHDIDKQENLEVDGWRMSGLLENVDRNSQSSSAHDLSSGKDNLISTFEERRKKNLDSKPTHSSTPLKDIAKESANEKENEVEDQNTITAHIKPVNIQVSFTSKDKKDEQSTEKKDHSLQHFPSNVPPETDGTDAVAPRPKANKTRVDEEMLLETRQADPECQIEFDDVSEPELAPVETCERSIICDIGRGKKVIIRHLTEVVTNGNLELSEKVTADDWLVLNMIKDDWVVVGYTKVGGEITSLFDQSVEAVY